MLMDVSAARAGLERQDRLAAISNVLARRALHTAVQRKIKPERARDRQDPDREAAKTGRQAGGMRGFIKFQRNFSRLY
jgi:hypothetical protein